MMDSNKSKRPPIKLLLQYTDILIAIVAAAALTLYSLVQPQDIALASTLTVSSLIAVLIALISMRLRLDNFSAKLLEHAEATFAPVLPVDFEDRLRRCTELWIIGIHQHEFFTAYHSQIVELAKNPTSRIRVLLVNPDSPASEMAAMRFPSPVMPVEGEIQNIRGSIRTLEQIRYEARCDFQVRTIDFLLPYGAFLIDSHRLDRARMYIEMYTFRILGGPVKPKIALLPTSAWYDFYHNEIQEFWKAGTCV